MRDQDPVANSVSDEELLEVYTEVLSNYPHLQKMLPPDYPKGTKYGITANQMQKYSTKREEEYWHHMNLPLIIHANIDPDPKASSFGKSVLSKLNDFSNLFGKLPGAQNTLQPLWHDCWKVKQAPEFWSVISCVFLALYYKRNGNIVEGFAQKIGAGGKNSDLTILRTDKVIMRVDVQLWHKAQMEGLTPKEVNDELRRRADNKVGEKFRDLPENQIGVAALVCVSPEPNFDLLTSNSGITTLINLAPERPRRYGYVYYLALKSSGTNSWLDILSPGEVSHELHI